MAKKKAKNDAVESESGFVREVADNLPENFEDLVAEYQESSRIAALWEKRKKDIGPIIETANILADKKHMFVGLYRITRIESQQPDRVSAEKLVEQGVEWEIIQKAMIPGTEYSYIQVSKLEEEA